MMLDEIRAEIEGRYEEMRRQCRDAELTLDRANRSLSIVTAELLAHDRCAEAIKGASAETLAKPPRRDIAALVREMVNAAGDNRETLTAAVIAKRLGTQTRLVTAALDRIAKESA